MIEEGRRRPFTIRKLNFDSAPIKHIKGILQELNLDPEYTFYKWVLAAPDELFKESVERHRDVIFNLEATVPGSPAVLQKEFGIACFGRYDIYSLLAQYYQRNELNNPYGVVTFPSYDWNGQFFHQFEAYAGLHQKLEKLGILTRFVEAESNIGIAKEILGLSYKYSPPIEFGVIASHGNKTGIALGYEHGSVRRDVAVGDLQDHWKFVVRVLANFKSGAPIVIDSCKAGAYQGFAHHLSAFSDAYITGCPWNWSVVKEFNPYIDPATERLVLNPKFRRAPSATYHKAEVVKI